MHNQAVKGICFVAALALLFLLSACGRMSSPRAPEGATYPQAYIVESN